MAAKKKTDEFITRGELREVLYALRDEAIDRFMREEDGSIDEAIAHERKDFCEALADALGIELEP